MVGVLQGGQAMEYDDLNAIKFEGVWRGMAKSRAFSSLYQFRSGYDIDDLVQEGFIVFEKCRQAYVVEQRGDPPVKTPGHFMSLYKTALTRHYWRLAKKQREDASNHCRDGVVSDESDESLDILDIQPDRDNMDPEKATALLHDLSDECRDFIKAHFDEEGLAILLDGPLYKRPLQPRRGELFARETSREFYARVADCDPDETDIQAELREILE